MRSAPEKGALRRTTSENSDVKDSWDIFEPRVPAPQSAPADSPALDHRANGCDLKELKHMTGRHASKQGSIELTQRRSKLTLMGANAHHAKDITYWLHHAQELQQALRSHAKDFEAGLTDAFKQAIPTYISNALAAGR